MGRVGSKPIQIPTGVDVTMSNNDRGTQIKVKGPKGTLEKLFLSTVKVAKDGSSLVLTATSEEKPVQALHGTYRALLQNMITGVTQGFEKKLTWTGVGYRMQAAGKGIKIQMGFSHDIDWPGIDGVQFKVEETTLTISGVDKELIGQIAADIRRIKPPEPYKGKGIRYVDEHIIRKAGKAAK
jgi:large subunit ribosomal protein L6